MNWKDLKIAKKLYVGFGVVLLLSILVGYVGYNGLSTVGQKVENADDANRLVKWVKDMATMRAEYMSTQDEQYYKDAVETIKQMVRAPPPYGVWRPVRACPVDGT